jgi:hypothetical protein
MQAILFQQALPEHITLTIKDLNNGSNRVFAKINIDGIACALYLVPFLIGLQYDV